MELGFILMQQARNGKVSIEMENFKPKSKSNSFRKNKLKFEKPKLKLKYKPL